MKFLVLDILGVYKAFVSPFLPPACRFEPTCSEYAREAVEKYGAPCIVVDFGTATTFNAINSKREYLGGIIAPGIMTCADALFDRAAKLPRVPIERPKSVIGKSTVEAMQSGLFYGYGNLVDGLLENMLHAMQETPKIIVTGGLARVIGDALHYVYEFDPNLTLDGLRIVYEKNKA